MSRDGRVESGRLKVLFVSWNFPPRRGGIEEMVAQLFRHLGAEVEVELWTGRAQEGAAPEQVRRSPLPGLVGFLAWLAFRLPLRMLREREERVLSSGALVGSVVEWIARLFDRPHAAILYGTDVIYPARAYQRWLRLSLPSVPLLLPISAAVEREVLGRGLGTAERLSRLSPGVDPRLGELPRATAPPRGDRSVILFVGRIIERKGLRPFVAHALPAVLERVDAELWIVGGDPEGSLAHGAGESERLRREVEGSAVEPHVRWLGRLSDDELRAAYGVADVLVLPAIEVEGDLEGFGIVFLEAAMFGVPAISTRLGGIVDAVEDGVTGRLVEPGDWRALAEALVRLLGDAPARREMGERARRRALERHAWPAIARTLAASLRNVARR